MTAQPALHRSAWMEEWSNPDGDIPLSPEVRSTIPHPYSNYEIVQALAESSPSGLVDESALSADLVAKWAARGDTIYTPPPNLDKKHPLTGAEIGLLAAIPVTWGLSVTALLTNTFPYGPADAMTFMVPISLTAIAYMIKHRYLPDRLRRIRDPYTRQQHAQLQRATADWPRPAQLSTYSNADRLQSEWDRRWPYVNRPGAAAAVWREPHLVGLAHRIAADITAGSAWQSELFDVHRVRINLPATLSEIRLRAFRIWRIRADTVAPTTAADPDGSAARRYQEITDALTDAEDRLIAMIAELAAYNSTLKPINALVDEIAALRLSAERVSEDSVRQLRIDAAGSDFKRIEIADTRTELEDLNANLTSQLEVLHSSLHLPESPLLLASTN